MVITPLTVALVMCSLTSGARLDIMFLINMNNVMMCKQNIKVHGNRLWRGIAQQIMYEIYMLIKKKIVKKV